MYLSMWIKGNSNLCNHSWRRNYHVSWGIPVLKCNLSLLSLLSFLDCLKILFVHPGNDSDNKCLCVYHHLQGSELVASLIAAGKPSYQFEAPDTLINGDTTACHIPHICLRFRPQLRCSFLLCCNKHVPCEWEHIMSNGREFAASWVSHLCHKLYVFIERR
jgi:hypothetical protein